MFYARRQPMEATVDRATERAQACLVAPAQLEPTEVPLPVGLREIPLTVEAAEELRYRLDNPSLFVQHEGKQVPVADASALRRKVR